MTGRSKIYVVDCTVLEVEMEVDVIGVGRVLVCTIASDLYTSWSGKCTQRREKKFPGSK
jgi:hypothetical protein